MPYRVDLKDERRTLNVQHRIMYSVNLKKAEQAYSAKWLRRPGANLLFEFLRFACFKIDKAQRHQYSTFDVGRSMFDVQYVHCFGQAKFHARLTF